MIIFKYILKLNFVLTLSIFLALNSYANVTQDENTKFLSALITDLNSKKLDSESVATLLKKQDPKKALEFLEWGKSNSGPLPAMSKFYLEDNLLKSKFDDQVISFKILSENEIEVVVKENKITILYTMTIEEMAKKIRSLENPNTKKTSFLSFFISDANAVLGNLIAMTIGALVTLYVLIPKYEKMKKQSKIDDTIINKIAKNTINVCTNIASSPVEDLNGKTLAENYNIFSKLFLITCVNPEDKYIRSCKSITEVKTCIKTKISELKSINSSNRSLLKDISYDGVLDRFIGNSVSK